jgi:hypothetical protein
MFSECSQNVFNWFYYRNPAGIAKVKKITRKTYGMREEEGREKYLMYLLEAAERKFKLRFMKQKPDCNIRQIRYEN